MLKRLRKIVSFFKIDFYAIKWFLKDKYQTFKYGSSHRKCWNLDMTLAKEILPHLRYFKRMRVGCPPALNKDGEEILNKNEGLVKLTSKEWDKVLDEMIFAFDFLLNEGKYIKFPIDVKKIGKKGGEIDKIKINIYHGKLDALTNRQKKGFILFGLYYPYLWD